MASKEIRKIECDKAPSAIGPYSQAVSAGEYVFVSGQIPISSGTGETASDDIRAQTALVLSNMETILASRGIGLDRVVKVDVFLRDMDDFPVMNEVYVEKFSGPVQPARQVVEAARLPGDVRIEMSCIAFAA